LLLSEKKETGERGTLSEIGEHAIDTSFLVLMPKDIKCYDAPACLTSPAHSLEVSLQLCLAHRKDRQWLSIALPEGKTEK
jgi:hypothetical protein